MHFFIININVFTVFVGIAKGFHQDFRSVHGFRFILRLRHLDDLAHDYVTLLMRFWLWLQLVALSIIIPNRT